MSTLYCYNNHGLARLAEGLAAGFEADMRDALVVCVARCHNANMA
jgi:hypothetical protein